MVVSAFPSCDVLEFLVLCLQVVGVAGLFVSRLLAGTRWAQRGRLALILAVIGLGVSGGLLGEHDSAFAMFAGGTMTTLLIGMTIGGGAGEVTDTIGAHLAG